MNQGKDLLGRLVGLTQVPKVKNGCLVRNRAATQKKPCKPLHRGNLIGGPLHRSFAQSTPLLHDANPVHWRQRVSSSAHSGLGLHGLNELDHRVQGQNRIFLTKESLSLGLLSSSLVLRTSPPHGEEKA